MLYTHVSTEKQSERYGIASQMTALQKRAEDNGWVVLPYGLSLTDNGYSGESLDRPAMNKLRGMLRQGAVQARLEANLRWARWNTRHLYLLSGLLHCGLCDCIHYTEGDYRSEVLNPRSVKQLAWESKISEVWMKRVRGYLPDGGFRGCPPELFYLPPLRQRRGGLRG